jgi:hypothetical protein
MMPPTKADIVAYADSIGEDIRPYAAALFIRYYKWKAPAVLDSPDTWQAAVRSYCAAKTPRRTRSNRKPRFIAPPQGIASAVALALASD